jgi:broad specificity phosphatase PhoE
LQPTLSQALKMRIALNLNDRYEYVEVPNHLCIIRHTNSWFNHHRTLSKEYPDIMSIFYGNSKWDADIQLSAIGKLQGIALMNYWNDEVNFNNRYSSYVASSYRRTRDTMGFISRDYVTSDHLIEKWAGQYYGYSQDQMIKTFPNYKELKKDQWNCKMGPENGTPEQFTESYSEVVSRIHKAVLELPSTNTAVVTHGEALTSFRFMLEAPFGLSFNTYLNEVIGKDYAQNGDIYEYDFVNRNFRNHRIMKDSRDEMKYIASNWQNIPS